MAQEKYDGYLSGIVVVNNDPNKQQRIKVMIPNVFEGDPANFPWVAPLVYSSFVVDVPDIGQRVAVYLQGGDILYGLTEGYPHDANKEVPAELLENYPHRRGRWDPFGNLFYTDSSTGHTVYKHKDNAFTSDIDADGNVTIHAEGNVAVTIVGNVTVVVQGNAQVTVDGSTTVHSQGNMSVSSDGTIDVQAAIINLN
jgi:hypothetical protein